MTKKMNKRQRWRLLSNMEMSFGVVMKEQAWLVLGGGGQHFLQTEELAPLCYVGSLRHLCPNLNRDSLWPCYPDLVFVRG